MDASHLSVGATYDLGILAIFLPAGTTYYSFGDFAYKLLMDPWVMRGWDICGLFFALGASLGFYFAYQFTIELFKTFMNQAQTGSSSFAF